MRFSLRAGDLILDCLLRKENGALKEKKNLYAAKVIQLASVTCQVSLHDEVDHNL